MSWHVKERLEGAEPSWVCPPDAEAFAKALLACPAPGIRSNGREKADDLDEGRIAERSLGLYREVAGDGLVASTASALVVVAPEMFGGPV